MNFIRQIFLALTFFLSATAWVSAQTDSIPLNNILQKKAQIFNDYPTEKVHLHFDKPYYAVGDTIWFKAYVTLEQRSPSPLSKILYVDIISNKDSLVESLKIPVTNSVASGNLPLYESRFKQGTYQLRAYTKWMLNFDPAYFFKKNIHIGNAISKELYTHVSFSGNRTDKTSSVTARVQYKDERGIPLMNKRVNWEVIADYERIAKGRGNTDNNGYLNISFNASSKVDINRGVLNTSLETGNIKPLTASFPLKTSILENDLQLFPEGGELIAQIPGKVAFKAIRSDGLGTDAQLEITDNTGNTVVKANSQHLGMGEFSFVPESGKTYKANVTFKDGSKKTTDLPPVKERGMSLSVSQDKDNILLRINANPAYLSQNNNKGFYIVAQNAGIVYYAAQSNIKNISYAAQIPKDKFPSGILQLTLLTANGTPVSERLTFIKRNDDILKIDIKSDLQAYTERQKVKLNIHSALPAKANAGNYSISVIDETKVPASEETETTILSNLLLSSDLTGYIEKPNYYFDKMDDKKAAHLDLLMLTQGYRKFLYKDAVAGKLPNITYLPEQGIDITGTIRRANGMPWEKARLLLQVPDRHFSTPAITDKEGRFKFGNVVFRDSSEVIINARNNVNSAKDIRIMIDGEPYPAIYSNVNAPDEILNLDSTLNTYLQNSKLQYSNAFMLKEVVVQASAEKKPSHLDHSSLSGLSMMADRVTNSEQLQACANLLNCLAGSGVTYIDNMLYLTRAYNQGTRVPMEIYVNGMPVDVNYLASIDAKGVESIEVFNNDGISGINKRTNTLGVLVVNLKEVKKTTISKDQLKELFPPANVLTFKPKGYSAERSFYVPKYNGPRPATQPKNLRTTIYWNPVVNTDNEGKASLEYFNGDDKGTYKVVVEGIDAEGNIGRGIYRYQIK